MRRRATPERLVSGRRLPEPNRNRDLSAKPDQDHWRSALFGSALPGKGMCVAARAANMPIAGDFVRRESDQREDGLRRAAFAPEKSNRLK